MEIQETIYRNVKALAKLKHEKISDVEKEIGVSTGYLSRTKGLGLEKVQKLACHFGKGIDDLITMDYWSVYGAEIAEDGLREAVRMMKDISSEYAILNIVREELQS